MKIFQNGVTTLWLDVASHVTSFNQSECIFANLVSDINAKYLTTFIVLSIPLSPSIGPPLGIYLMSSRIILIPSQTSQKMGLPSIIIIA